MSFVTLGFVLWLGSGNVVAVDIIKDTYTVHTLKYRSRKEGVTICKMRNGKTHCSIVRKQSGQKAKWYGIGMVLVITL